MGPMSDPMQSDLQRMRRDWDARAREDAKHYIATGLSDGLLFGLGGLHDANKILEDVHTHLTQQTRVLEIGCGIGRLLRFFALVFDEVYGIDVSAEMIRQSKAHLAQFSNVKTYCGDGSVLSPFEDGSIGFVFSYVVFLHVPSKDIIRSYVHEARRVLEPGGVFKFLVKYREYDTAGDAPDTWHGVTVSMDDVEVWRAETGFELVNSYGVDEHLGWVVFRACAPEADS